MLRDDEPKEGSGYTRYGWRKGCFMLCVELATTMNSVLNLSPFPGRHFDNTLTLCIYPTAMRGFAMSVLNVER